MLEQKKKTMRKGTFFFKLGSAHRCHRLESEKMYLSGKRVGFQHNSDKNAVIRGYKCKLEIITEQ